MKTPIARERKAQPLPGWLPRGVAGDIDGDDDRADLARIREDLAAAYTG